VAISPNTSFNANAGTEGKTIGLFKTLQIFLVKDLLDKGVDATAL
jgi:hypothetical protein